MTLVTRDAIAGIGWPVVMLVGGALTYVSVLEEMITTSGARGLALVVPGS